jgi:acetyl-CoA acetyltransferase
MVRRARAPWRARALGGLGRIVSWGVAGVDPDIMGRGPVPASGRRSSTSINEAFAAQYLAVERELGVKHFKKPCPPGDIAHEMAVPLPGRGRR